MVTPVGKSKSSRISRIELTPVFVPFREFIRKMMQSGAGGLGMAIAAEEPWTGEEFVICKLFAEDGTIGISEVFVWLPETGVCAEHIIGIIERALAKYVIGESPFDFERINQRMDNNVARNEVAKGLIDMACYDLMGKISGKRAGDLMGGIVTEKLPLAALVPLTDIDVMVALSRDFHKAGFNTLRIKLGNSVSEDAKIMESVRGSVGGDVRLRVDYNQAYDTQEAVSAIKAIEPFGIDYAEQPVALADFVGMSRVQKQVSTPLMSHEGCFSLGDIMTLAELGAIGVVGINSERPGGVTKALRAIEFARERKMGVVIHNQPLGIASAMLLHLAAASYNSLGHATELFGNVMLEDDLIVNPIDYSGGYATLPEGAGWGVELDEDALKHYASGPTTVIKA